MLKGKRILLGITGGIAAYKAAALVRLLVRAGADVRVAMTEAATRFVTPVTFQALSNQPVWSDLWDQRVPDAMGHIELSRSEEHTSELQSPCNLVCRLLLEKKKQPAHSNAGTRK